MLPTSPTQVPSSAGRERARQLIRRVLGRNHAVLCTRDAGYGRTTSPHVLPRRYADGLLGVWPLLLSRLCVPYLQVHWW